MEYGRGWRRSPWWIGRPRLVTKKNISNVIWRIYILNIYRGWSSFGETRRRSPVESDPTIAITMNANSSAVGSSARQSGSLRGGVGRGALLRVTLFIYTRLNVSAALRSSSVCCPEEGDEDVWGARPRARHAQRAL
jgi:hypothetical protein